MFRDPNLIWLKNMLVALDPKLNLPTGSCFALNSDLYPPRNQDKQRKAFLLIIPE